MDSILKGSFQRCLRKSKVRTCGKNPKLRSLLKCPDLVWTGLPACKTPRQQLKIAVCSSHLVTFCQNYVFTPQYVLLDCSFTRTETSCFSVSSVPGPVSAPILSMSLPILHWHLNEDASALEMLKQWLATSPKPPGWQVAAIHWTPAHLWPALRCPVHSCRVKSMVDEPPNSRVLANYCHSWRKTL